MAWIEGSEEQTFVVNAPYEKVANFFGDPGEFQCCIIGLESAERMDPLIWHWVLNEKTEKGVSYQADYTVAYNKQGDGVIEWQTIKGNLRTEGISRCTKLDEDRTEVYYRETIASDLPIPRLLAKVFSPIVAREIRQGVTGFLANSREWLETGGGAGDDSQ
jgi:uncharacterized membrane protein